MRLAVILEDGEEIWRGKPAHMPIRFVTNEDELPLDIVEVTMSMIVDIGTPIDPETGQDMIIVKDDLY